MRLPWRSDAPKLPDNKRVAQKRFENLKRNLKGDVSLFRRFNEVIQDYLQQGICERAPEPKQSHGVYDSNIEYYLAHHAVIREDKVTTKLRVVFDASSHEDGFPSLND